MAQEPTNTKDLNLKEKSVTYGDRRRAERKEALRELLEGQKYIQAIHNTLDMPIANDELAVAKFKTETRLKLLAKVLPDLKAVEVSADDDTLAQVYGWLDANEQDTTSV
jgi:hypothetical protein